MPNEENFLETALDSVGDEETFLQFLLALRDHREASIAQERQIPSSPFGPHALGWQNTTIERYFYTAVRWARASSQGLPLTDYKPPSNPWRRCADILYAAISYE
jgi:hypothetical protein